MTRPTPRYADVFQHFKITPDWRSLEEYFQRLTKQGSGINLGTYVGAAQVRRLIIGTANRQPTPAELKDMEIAVDDAMSDGAMGVSTFAHLRARKLRQDG